MAAKSLNKKLNKGRARKADNKRLCRELLKKGNTQREIAKILNISLPTANTYCQEIAREIEEAQKAEQEKEVEERELIRKRKRRVREVRQMPVEDKTPEELARDGFTACLKELQARLPEMTNEEVMKITVDLWDRVNR
jgi:predicted transcriptional regulator